MEEAVAGMEMAASVVASRVNTLNGLLDDLDVVHPKLTDVKNQQSSAVWTDIPSCETFALRYRQALDVSRANLGRVWTDIETLALGLKESAAAITDVDEATQQALEDLVRRLDEDRPSYYTQAPDGFVGPWVPPEVLYPAAGSVGAGSDASSDNQGQ